MSMSIISLAFVCLLSHLLILTAQSFVYYKCFNESGNYTNTSAYHTNLNILLSNFTSDTKIDYGFYTYSYGQGPDIVDASGICRGDVKPNTCRSCINNATMLLPKLCPNQKEAFGFYDLCIFRYSNPSMSGIYQYPDFYYAFNNQEEAKDPNKYKDSLDLLMLNLKTIAAAGDSHRKVAVGNATVDKSQTVYGLAQCMPDLSQQDCDACFLKAMSDISVCCQDKVGGRVIKFSCNIWFDHVLFYDPTVIDSAQLSLPTITVLPPCTNTTSSQDPEKQRLLNWSDRFKIIRGIAQGLWYMHEYSRVKVIHRDLKPCNILLDNKMNPKISDFGIARMIATDEDKGSTKRIVGTYGYMAPEYLIYGHFSEKSDLFSFGVIILEVLSSKKNAKSYESFFLADVWKQWNEGTPLQILDPSLMESCCKIEAMRCVQVGLLCVQKNPEERPTMAQVVSYLSNLSIDLPTPREPPFLIHLNPTMSTEASSDQTIQSSNTVASNETSITEILPR